MREKLDKVRKRRYIGAAFVKSLTAFFAVRKGTDDIRMVYDGTISGLNDSIWVPRFILPTLETHLRAVDEGTYMADVDVGDCFLNFMLHPTLRELAGVDLSHYFGEGGKVIWEAWKCAGMGVKSSPFQAVLALTVADEIIKGNHLDEKNEFRWVRVRFNLPGNHDYDPSIPWVLKVREDRQIASDLFTFVDDLRPTGPGRVACWKAARRAASVLNWLGIQDAPRKRRDSSQSPGAWSGSVIRVTPEGVCVLASEDKWIKAKGMLTEIRKMIDENPVALPRLRLEQIRGFLIYVTRTYPCMVPYLIGLHMTIDSWRPNRKEDGWRYSAAEMRLRSEADDEVEDESQYDHTDAPKNVTAVPRLNWDIGALAKLMRDEKPLLRRVRMRRAMKAYCGFGDASGYGFGATMQIGDDLWFEYGQWSSEIAEDSSSNWRELANLVNFIERSVEAHNLDGIELFIFTDNQTAESAFWKGHSSSPKLFALVLQLRRLEMEHGLSLHSIHVSGKIMIAQGTDGLSRADHSTGVMTGRDITNWVPLNKGALEREAKLVTWLDQVTRGMGFHTLTPYGWFTAGHDYGNSIWAPPPAAADVVVEQMGKAIMKRPESMHIIVVPRLMTGRWRRNLGRRTDGYFKLDCPFVWDLRTHFEPVLIYVCLPYVSSRPRLSERGKLLDEFRGALPKADMPPLSARRGRIVLRKLLLKARELCPLPRRVVP
jgi:hypothetical protein